MRPEQLLMGAYYRRTGEDRVTEVLATVLQSTPTYVAGLAQLAGLPAAEEYLVETQVPGPGVVADLEIHALSGRTPQWLLWSEHKLHSPFSKQQLTKLTRALRTKAGDLPSRLIAITLQEPPADVLAEARENGVEVLRWRDVVAASNAEGSAVGGPTWRTLTQEDGEVRSRRLLLEWQAFCSRELEETAVQPLTTRQVEILLEVEPALDTLEHLLESGFRTGCRAIGAGNLKEKADYWSAQAPAGSWLLDQGCVLYAKTDTDDSWTAAPSGDAIFIAGIWAEGENAEALRTSANLVQRLGDQGFSFWDEGTGRAAYFDVSRTLGMSAVAARTTLDEQEALVAELCESAFRALLVANGGPEAQ
jgi:hypothetical protein